MYILLRNTLLFSFIILITLSTAHADEADWSGEWRSYWANGQAVLHIEQNGTAIEGEIHPGNATIEGVAEGKTLRGSWTGDDGGGTFIFVMDPDGRTFTGRYDGREYWNGTRSSASRFVTPLTRTDTPGQSLRTALSSLNLSLDYGVSEASLIWEPLLVYDGDPTPARNRNQRLSLFKQLLDMTTVDINVSVRGDESGRHVIYATNSGWEFPVNFLKEGDVWKIRVPELDVLQQYRDDGLQTLGYTSVNEFTLANQRHPRQVMRDFIEGSIWWDSGQADKALATFDLSHLPPYLRKSEGAMYVDYMAQIITRLEYIIWQELPNITDVQKPYVYYSHPKGNIIIEPHAQEEEGKESRIVWHFSNSTVQNLPTLYNALADLPVADGLHPRAPLSRFFAARQTMVKIHPVFGERWILFENWQWIALGMIGVLLALITKTISWLAKIYASYMVPGQTQGRAMVIGIQLLVAGGLFAETIGAIGIREDVAPYLFGAAAITMIFGGILLAVQIVDWIFVHFVVGMEKIGYQDDLVYSLLRGLAKFTAIITGVLLAAQTIGVPYEGVIAGLSISGLMLAIAAKDTVSNVISAAILLIDRPFEVGDTIMTGSHFGTVEHVGLRSTQIRSIEDSVVFIPNNKLTDMVLDNRDRRKARRLDFRIGLRRDTAPEALSAFCQAVQEMISAMPQNNGGGANVGISQITLQEIQVRVICYMVNTGYDQYVKDQHEILEKILASIKSNNLNLATPEQSIHLIS